MRILFFLSVTILFLCSCSNSSDTESQTKDSTEITGTATLQPINELFPELYQYFHSQDSSFNSAGFEEGRVVVKNDSLNFKTDSSELRKFYPWLLFNADSSFALDLVSYNYHPEKRNGKIIMQEMGPDFETAVVNMKTKESKRLLFFGPSGASVLDAKWTNNETVLMAGAIDWTGGDSLRPVIWKYNVAEKTLQQFVYNRMINADWSKYPKELYDLTP